MTLMFYECADCGKTFNIRQAIGYHCSAKGHSQYECDVCDTGRKFKNRDALDKVNHLF